MEPKRHVSRGRTKAEPVWVVRLRRDIGRGPKAAAIAQGLSRAVTAGELALGERLPPQRTLAYALGVDLTTVTRGYAEARAMGVLAGETGRGTFVRGEASPNGPVIDLSMNLPPPPGEQSLRDLLQQGFADLLKHGEPGALMTYRSGFGARRDRRAAQSWLAPRLGEVADGRLFIAPGAQSTLAALLMMLARAGDVVLAEPQTYPGFIAAARLLGVRVAAMVCDAGGPVIAALETQCRKLRPKAIYITPTLQNPPRVR